MDEALTCFALRTKHQSSGQPRNHALQDTSATSRDSPSYQHVSRDTTGLAALSLRSIVVSDVLEKMQQQADTRLPLSAFIANTGYPSPSSGNS